MKWIQNFSDSKIPFYIYKLNPGDYITHTSKQLDDKCFIVLQGLTYIIKVFNNQTIIVLGIFGKDDIIKETKNTTYYNYSIIAIETTLIISFSWKNIIKSRHTKFSFFFDIIKSYNQTLHKYELMESILSHKSTKKRIIQLIFFLCREFSVVENTNIIVPFYISQITISTIIGSNKSTVNRIITFLCRTNIISYYYHKYICLNNPFILSYCYDQTIK